MNKVLVLLYLMTALSSSGNVADVLPKKDGMYDVLKFYSTSTDEPLKHRKDNASDEIMEKHNDINETKSSKEDEQKEEVPQEESSKEEFQQVYKDIEEKDTQIVQSSQKQIQLIHSTRQIDVNKPMVALTFDDGPNSINTNRILDTLEKYNVVATFFELGYLVEQNPKVVKREENLGCEVANHSYKHNDFNKLTVNQLKEDMIKSEKAFEKVLGHKTKLFRPPYGNANETVRSTITYPLINWNVDTLDWKSRNESKIMDKVREISNYDGKIILMHSIYSSTAKAVEIIVPELIEKGYQLVTVSELATCRGYQNLDIGRIYYGFSKQ